MEYGMGFGLGDFAGAVCRIGFTAVSIFLPEGK